MDDTTTTTDDPILPDDDESQSAAAPDTTAAQQPAEPTSTNEASDEPVQATDNSDDDQADYADLKQWADKKGYDLTTEDGQARAWKSLREAEKRMHESTAKASQLEKTLTQSNPTPGDLADTPLVEQLAAEVRNLKTQQSVNSFWTQNPEAKEFEGKMAEIVTSRPEIGQLVTAGYLSIDDLYKLARSSDSGRDAKLKEDGGREALKKVAAKQQAKAVSGAATISQFSDNTPEDDFLKGFNAN